MSDRRLRLLSMVIVVALAAAGVVLAAAPDALAAAGNDVGKNFNALATGYAAEIFGGVVAIFGIPFLVHRRYTELAMFLLAAIVVGWLVFSPDRIANTARVIAGELLP